MDAPHSLEPTARPGSPGLRGPTSDPDPGRPRRVLLCTHGYPPGIGGCEEVFRRLAEGLAGRGHRIHVAAPTSLRTEQFTLGLPPSLPSGVVERAGVTIHRLEYARLPRSLQTLWHRTARLWWRLRAPGYGYVKCRWAGPRLPALPDLVRRLAPEIILTTAAPFRTTVDLLPLGRRLGVPVAVKPGLHPGDPWFVDNPWLWRTLSAAAAFLVQSEHEGERLAALGCPGDRMHYLGAGVDLERSEPAEPGLRRRFSIPTTAPIVLFLGRKEPAKGVAALTGAMKQLWREGSEAWLVLAGAATEDSRRELRRELGPAEAVRVVDRDEVSEAEKWGWLEACTLLAQPSRIDALGLVYLEAWAAGKPVVAGRTPAQSELIEDGVTGRLVELDDPSELVAALRGLTTEPATAARLGAAGRRRASHRHRWSQVVDRAEVLVRHLVP